MIVPELLLSAQESAGPSKMNLFIGACFQKGSVFRKGSVFKVRLFQKMWCFQNEALSFIFSSFQRIEDPSQRKKKEKKRIQTRQLSQATHVETLSFEAGPEVVSISS